MSTNSSIGYVDEHGQIVAVYCHFDGYNYHPGVGAKVKRIKTRAEIKEIVSNGDMSSFNEHFYKDKPGEKWDDIKPMSFPDLQQWFDYYAVPFFYLLDRGDKWRCWYYGKEVPVNERIKEGEI